MDLLQNFQIWRPDWTIRNGWRVAYNWHPWCCSWGHKSTSARAGGRTWDWHHPYCVTRHTATLPHEFLLHVIEVMVHLLLPGVLLSIHLQQFITKCRTTYSQIQHLLDMKLPQARLELWLSLSHIKETWIYILSNPPKFYFFSVYNLIIWSWNAL